MAAVELVIRIPEGAYNLLKTSGVDWLGAEHILNAVANGKPLDSVFDQIKAEIMSLDCIDEDKYEGTSIDPMVYRDDVLQIINKYKESEAEKDEPEQEERE